eukprot:SAG22_NODE_1243_length_5022_cov_3.983953_2_plen_94_part_00
MVRNNLRRWRVATVCSCVRIVILILGSAAVAVRGYGHIIDGVPVVMASRCSLEGVVEDRGAIACHLPGPPVATAKQLSCAQRRSGRRGPIPPR